PLARIDRVRRRQAVPARHVGHGDVVAPGDRVERVAALDDHARTGLPLRRRGRGAGGAAAGRGTTHHGALAARGQHGHQRQRRQQAPGRGTTLGNHANFALQTSQATTAATSTVAIHPSGSIQRRSASAARAPPKRIAAASRYTRLPRPTSMLRKYGSSGTPTIPEAQVKTFIGIGMKPPSTRNQNTAQGDSAILAWTVAMPASIPGSMPIIASSGLIASKAKWPRA